MFLVTPPPPLHCSSPGPEGVIDRIRNVISVTYGFTLEVMPLNFTVHHGTWREKLGKV